jgi:hypothetical protein
MVQEFQAAMIEPVIPITSPWASVNHRIDMDAYVEMIL